MNLELEDLSLEEKDSFSKWSRTNWEKEGEKYLKFFKRYV